MGRLYWDVMGYGFKNELESQMKKPGAKSSEETSKLLKLLITLVFKIPCLLTWVILITLVLYGVIQKATMELSFQKEWPALKITPKSNIQLPELKVDTLSKPKTIDISRLPNSLQGNDPDETLAKINNFWQEMQKQRNSIWHSCCVISTEIALKVSIDTAIRDDDEHTKETYRCVQVCLKAIGYYDGELDGDQGRTKAALATFQKAKSLKVDSKIGRQTWNAMLAMLEKEIHG